MLSWLEHLGMYASITRIFIAFFLEVGRAWIFGVQLGL
jgi:hypothetical protein